MLVIVGLIVGGVLVGQDLIEAAKVRSLVSDKTKYETAGNTFRLKYDCIAGDCSNAANLGVGINGNGDKKLSVPYAPLAGIYEVETWEYWKQLANAGLIEGEYTGIGLAGMWSDSAAVIGSNIPATKFANGGWSIYPAWQQNNITGGNMPASGHYLVFGRVNTAEAWQTFGGLLTLTQVYQIDQKFDDGVAATGGIRTWQSLSQHETIGCTSGTAPTHTFASPLSDDVSCVVAWVYSP